MIPVKLLDPLDLPVVQWFCSRAGREEIVDGIIFRYPGAAHKHLQEFRDQRPAVRPVAHKFKVQVIHCRKRI